MMMDCEMYYRFEEDPVQPVWSGDDLITQEMFSWWAMLQKHTMKGIMDIEKV